MKNLKGVMVLVLLFISIGILSACGTKKAKNTTNTTKEQTAETSELITAAQTGDSLTATQTTESTGDAVTSNQTTDNMGKVDYGEPATPGKQGTVKHFAFDFKGKKYEFQESDKLKLFLYSPESTNLGSSVSETHLTLSLYVNNEEVRLLPMSDEDLNALDKKNIVSNENEINVYEQKDADFKDNDYYVISHYIVYKDFGFYVDFNQGMLENVSTQEVIPNYSEIANVLKETDANTAVGDPAYQLMTESIVGNYRVAFREGTVWSWSILQDGDSGMAADLFLTFPNYTKFQDYGINISIENNMYVSEDNEDYKDTGYTYDNKKVYYDTFANDYEIIFSDHSRITIEVNYGDDLTGDDIQYILDTALSKLN